MWEPCTLLTFIYMYSLSYLVVKGPVADGVCACVCSSSLGAVCASVCTVLGAGGEKTKFMCVNKEQYN